MLNWRRRGLTPENDLRRKTEETWRKRLIKSGGGELKEYEEGRLREPPKKGLVGKMQGTCRVKLIEFGKGAESGERD